MTKQMPTLANVNIDISKNTTWKVIPSCNAVACVQMVLIVIIVNSFSSIKNPSAPLTSHFGIFKNSYVIFSTFSTYYDYVPTLHKKKFPVENWHT